MKSLLALILIVWLAIGTFAAYQRGYFGDNQDVDCAHVSDTLLTIGAGPLNYMGINPTVDCTVPEPSE